MILYYIVVNGDIANAAHLRHTFSRHAGQFQKITSLENVSTCEETYHANNKVVARFIPFSVLGFWVKNTGICAGAMPYRRDFTATTRI